MKVKIEMTLDIDAEAWETNYGVPAIDHGLVRRDVRTYVVNGTVEHLRDLGLLVST